MIETQIEKATLLIEALPYIKRFRGKYVLVKLGGSVMFDNELKQVFAKDILLLKLVGIHPVVVHGGGKEITTWMEKFGKKPVFVEGLRVTDEETMCITEMVLSGKINSEIVSVINREGGRAVGLSGKDGSIFTARKLRSKQKVDLGLVGEIDTTDISLITQLSEQGYIPIISSVSETIEGETLNLNADYAAAGIAAALKAMKLIYLTDVDGIYINNQLVENIDLSTAEELLLNPQITDGMKPKLECAIAAIKGTVDHVHVINGARSHAVLLELFTDSGVGTKLSYHQRRA